MWMWMRSITFRAMSCYRFLSCSIFRSIYYEQLDRGVWGSSCRVYITFRVLFLYVNGIYYNLTEVVEAGKAWALDRFRWYIDFDFLSSSNVVDAMFVWVWKPSANTGVSLLYVPELVDFIDVYISASGIHTVAIVNVKILEINQFSHVIWLSLLVLLLIAWFLISWHTIM